MNEHQETQQFDRDEVFWLFVSFSFALQLNDIELIFCKVHLINRV